MTASDLATLATILRDAARKEILPRFSHLAAGAVRHKTGPLDLVTDADADEAAQRMIAAQLARHFPNCLIVGEKAASADPSGLTACPTPTLRSSSTRWTARRTSPPVCRCSA
jgi:fructose-1,6-bisphosphatase/inositol monophosphatase family enzyme